MLIECFFLEMSENIEKINQLIRQAESLELDSTEENIAQSKELRKQLRAIPDPEPVDEKPKLLPFTDPYEFLASLYVPIKVSSSSLLEMMRSPNTRITSARWTPRTPTWSA